MKALVVRGPKDIHWENFEQPSLSSDEVKIAVRACGMCGSDLPRMLGDGAHFYPIVVGHEFSGVVTEVGEHVDERWIGKRVAVAPLMPCFSCASCEIGHYSSCKKYSFIGSRRQGGFAESVNVPVKNVIELHPDLSFIEGALLEPATVPLHGLLKCNNLVGGSVLVLGAGLIGLLAAQWCRILGASKVVVSDLNAKRLEVARSLGFEVCGSIADGDVRRSLGKVDLVVDVTDVSRTKVDAVNVAGDHGEILLIGGFNGEVVFSAKEFENILRKELKVIGSWMSFSLPFPGREWTMAQEALVRGNLDIRPFVSKVFPMHTAPEILKQLEQGDLNPIKLIFTIDDGNHLD